MTEILKVQNLQTEFTQNERQVRILDNLNFQINKGEILGLVGESGSGKSVTSLSIMQLFKGTTGKIVNGEIFFQGENILNLTEDEMRKIRGKRISMIFQEPMTSLNPMLKIGEQLLETVRLHLGYRGKQASEYTVNLLKKVGIPRPDEVMKDFPHQLSGGMRQRVMIAIAVSCNPDLLIADEPTTALDVTIQAQILELLKNIQDETNMSMLLITHDLGLVAEMCDRVIVMYAGEIVEEAPVLELFDNPQHPYTKGLISSMPKMGQKIKKLSSIPGNVPDPLQMPKGCKFAPRCSKAIKICLEKEPELLAIDDNRLSRCWITQQKGGL